MRESIGSVFLYNIIILFIIIVFGILSATISYYKAFKVNERLLYSLDKFEGYNSLSKKEMEEFLSSIGYTYEPTGQAGCGTKDDATLVKNDSSKYLYCVYYFSDDRGSNEKKLLNGDKEPIYYNYAITSYIYVDLPIAGKFKVPVYTKGERIYNFSDHQKQEGAKA
mgnify:FL=1